MHNMACPQDPDPVAGPMKPIIGKIISQYTSEPSTYAPPHTFMSQKPDTPGGEIIKTSNV